LIMSLTLIGSVSAASWGTCTAGEPAGRQSAVAGTEMWCGITEMGSLPMCSSPTAYSAVPAH
jgi:hypothetical protein